MKWVYGVTHALEHSLHQIDGLRTFFKNRLTVRRCPVLTQIIWDLHVTLAPVRVRVRVRAKVGLGLVKAPLPLPSRT